MIPAASVAALSASKLVLSAIDLVFLGVQPFVDQKSGYFSTKKSSMLNITGFLCAKAILV